MNPQHFNGERLKNARLYRAMTLTDLAENINVTKQAVSQYENETITPDPSNVFDLAKTLGFPIEYFFTKSKYTVKTETAYFRSLMSTSKKDRTAQSVRLEFIAQIYEMLFDYIDFPTPRLPSIEFSDHAFGYLEEDEESAELEQIADELRVFWQLGRGPINDLRYTLEANGIVTTCAPLNADKIDAFSQRTVVNGYGVYFIVISKDGQSVARARFDMAHELGHILLHPWSEDLESISREEFKSRERQANVFASSFLLPRDTFGHEVRLCPTNLEYYQRLKSKWNVSIAAMVYRTRQLDIITPNQFQYLMKQISRNGWRSGEPGDQQYIPKSTLLQGAVELLFSSGEMAISDFLSELCGRGIVMNPSEIEDLLCLKPDTLKVIKPKQANLIRLKPQNGDDDLETSHIKDLRDRR